MQTIRTESLLRDAVRFAKASGKKVAFVPTMGYLHTGHLSLVKLAKSYAEYVVVSIFVNPAQFNDPKDLKAYPVDIDRDSGLLKGEGADLLYIPSADAIYGAGSSNEQISRASALSSGFQSWVEVSGLSQRYEGASRAGHFRGVSTIVSILFNLVTPDYAVFGEKDFQQLRIIEQMVKDLKFPLSIVRGPLVREKDGLAMSSRNVRLSPEARAASLNISAGLMKAHAAWKQGEKNSAALMHIAREEFSRSPLLECDYLEVVSEESLDPVAEVTKRARLLAAVNVTGVRLLDNIELG